MKKIFLALAALVLAGTAAYAQKKSNLGEVMFQEASAREASPTVNFFVFPQICDLQMLSNQREDYGPYDFPMAKDLSTLTNQELENVKTRALQKACALAGADLMLEPFYTSTVYDKDNRVIWVSISGFPAKYTNFRSLAEKVTPAPDEAFAKSLGFDSLDALKADLRAKKQKIHEEGADRAAGKLLLDMAGANMTVDLPAEILDRTARNEMKLLTERLSRSGITLEQHCKNSHTTPEALEKDYRAQAESRIRFVLAARAIAEAEGIVVHPEEVNAEYRRLSQLQDTPEAEIRKALAEDAVAAALAAKKVQRFLLDNAQVTTVTDAPEKE